MAANAARKTKIDRGRFGRTADNGNSGKFTFAFAYSLKKCGAFGAVGGGIRCAFNISSAKNFSAFAKKGGAYAKM